MKRRKVGPGFKPKNQESRGGGLGPSKYYNEGRGFAQGGYVLSPSTGGAGGGLGRLRKAKAAAKIPDKTEL
jgi:hypothetical protein